MSNFAIYKSFGTLVDHFLSECHGTIQQSPVPEDTKMVVRARLNKTFIRAFLAHPYQGPLDLLILNKNVSTEKFLTEVISEMRLSGSSTDADSLEYCFKTLVSPDGKLDEIYEPCIKFLIALSSIDTSGGKLKNLLCTDLEKTCETDLPGETTLCDYRHEQNNFRFPLYYGDFFQFEELWEEIPGHHDYSSLFALDPGNGMTVLGNLMSSKVLNENDEYAEYIVNEEKMSKSYSSAATSQSTNFSSWSRYDELSFSLGESFEHSISSQLSAVRMSEDCKTDDEQDSKIFSADDQLLSGKESTKAAVLSWENIGRAPVTDRPIYATECGPDFFDLLINNYKENSFDACSSLPSFIVSATDIRHLLLCISSETLKIIKGPNNVKVIPRKKARGITDTSFEAMIASYTTMAEMFNNLRNFSEAFTAAEKSPEGLVLNLLRFGVSEYLHCYEYCVASTSITGMQPIYCLNNIFRIVGHNIRYMTQICGFSDDPSGAENIPTGIELVSYLYHKAEENTGQHTYISLLLLIKHAFKPFFRFLSQWLFHGILDGNLTEFHLQENDYFVTAKDETYWTKFYESNTGRPEDFAPDFLQDIASDIFICGKSFNLLKRCCPQHHLFCVWSNSPTLDLHFSEKSVSEVEVKHAFIMLERLSKMIEYHGAPVYKSSESVDSEFQYPTGSGLLEDSSADGMKEIVNFGMKQATLMKFQLEAANSLQKMLVEKGSLIANNLFETSGNDCSGGSMNCSEDEVGNTGSQNERSTSFLTTVNVPRLPPVLVEKDVIDFLGGGAINNLLAAIAKSLIDTDEEAEAALCYIKKEHIAVIVKRCLHPLILAQIDLVNKFTLEYFFLDLKLNDHFETLAMFFFLRDGEFGHALSANLFDAVCHSKSPSCVFKGVQLYVILQQALSSSIHGESPYVKHLMLCPQNVPETFPKCVLETTKCMRLQYDVGWPCNVIITERHLSSYSNVLSFLIQVHHVMSCISDMWFYLKEKSVEIPALHGSPQYRNVQICRHSMLHFIKAMQGHLAYEMLIASWVKLQTDIKEKIRNFEDLRTVHSEYIQRAIQICMLNRRSSSVLAVITSTFRCILAFSNVLRKYEWQYNSSSGNWENLGYQCIMKEYEEFKNSSRLLYQVSRKLFYTKDLDHLESLLLLMNFNRQYKKGPSVF